VRQERSWGEYQQPKGMRTRRVDTNATFRDSRRPLLRQVGQMAKITQRSRKKQRDDRKARGRGWKDSKKEGEREWPEGE